MAQTSKTTSYETKKKYKMQPGADMDMNVVDLILMDHKYLKECIDVLSDADADKKHKAKIAKSFLDTLQKHSEAEKASLYADLINNPALRFDILEGEIEHEIVDKKVKMLKPKLAAKTTALKDQLEAELKVLAELVKHHIKEEESEMLPKVRSEIDEDVLTEIGSKFFKKRKFTEQDLSMNWKDSLTKFSKKFVTKMDKYIDSLKH